MSLESGRLLRVVGVMLTLAVLVALPALAHSSPPDPSWIPGIYDGADLDDVVVLVSSGPDGAPITVSPELRPVDGLVHGLPYSQGRATQASAILPLHPRAPPAS